jgi:hypothetical protein
MIGGRHIAGSWRFWQPTPYYLLPTGLGLVLVAVILVTLLSRRANRAWRVVTAVVSLVWFPLNAPVEGPVLFRVTPSHGLTAADLIGFAGLVVAIAAPALRRRLGRLRRPAIAGAAGSADPRGAVTPPCSDKVV